MYQIDLMTIPVYRIKREIYYEQRSIFTENRIFGGSDAEFKRKYCEDNPDYFVIIKMQYIKIMVELGNIMR